MRMRWHMKSAPPAYAHGAHKDILRGEYFVDLLINDMLLVELKTVKDWTTRIECNAPII